MTHPTHPSHPTHPPHPHTPSQPPSPNASIDNYELAFVVVAVVLITRFGYRMRSLSTIHKH